MNSKVSRHFRSRYKLAIFCATTWVFDTTCVNPKWHMTCNIIITFMVIHHYFSLCQVRQVSVDCFPKMTLENVFWCPSESVTKKLWHSLEGTSIVCNLRKFKCIHFKTKKPWWKIVISSVFPAVYAEKCYPINVSEWKNLDVQRWIFT